jgi:hypothetical protein
MRLRRTLALLIASLAAALGGATGAEAVYFPAQPIDGPSADISSFGGIAVAPDGTGALVYLKKDGGQDHVFVSTLSNGAWSAPQRVDVGAALPSETPRVAVGNGGRAVVVYVGGVGGDEALMSALKPAGGGFGAPTPIYDPAGATALTSPAVDMNAGGVAYAIVTDLTGVDQVFGTRLEGAAWTQIPTSLNQDPTLLAEPSSNGPDSAVGVDGSGKRRRVPQPAQRRDDGPQRVATPDRRHHPGPGDPVGRAGLRGCQQGGGNRQRNHARPGRGG